MYEELNVCRAVWVRPYAKGLGPCFRLRMWDNVPPDARGSLGVDFELTAFNVDGSRETIFPRGFGPEYSWSATDSDERVYSVCQWLAMKPGDTDPEYFDRYTESQLTFARSHAEDFGCEADSRFRVRCEDCGAKLTRNTRRKHPSGSHPRPRRGNR